MSEPEPHYDDTVFFRLVLGITAFFVALFLFGVFHFWLWTFSMLYRLSVHFGYLP